MGRARKIEPIGKYSDSIEDLVDSHLMCREKHHSWQHVTDRVMTKAISGPYKGQPIEIQREWKCSRCVTGQLETIRVPSFDLITRKYFYPDGYLLSRTALAEFGRVSVRELRQESLTRAGLISATGSNGMPQGAPGTPGQYRSGYRASRARKEGSGRSGDPVKAARKLRSV